MRMILAPFAISMIALTAGASLATAAERFTVQEATLVDGGKTSEVSTSELRNALAAKNALLLDTRSRLEYDAGHIPGAINLDSVTASSVREAARGDMHMEIILYCNGPFCQASRRAADALTSAGFSNVRRYQLGIPVWRALGGPVAVEESGIRRIHGKDATAVFIDLRPNSDFRRSTMRDAINAPADSVISGKVKLQLPEDDFNRRIILLGDSAEQARQVADLLGSRPWHNVSYFKGDIRSLLVSQD